MPVTVCQFIASLDLQELFRDKDTGLPLSSGKVYFWEDEARTIPKPVYKFSGTPTDPEYEALPNPVVLNSAGAFDDAVYYYPYDADGNVQLYYVQWFNSDGVPQFTREQWPPGICSGSNPDNEEPSINYFANPQFRMHLDVNGNPDEPGRVTLPITNIGPGAWTFEVDENFTSTNVITYPGFTETISDPPGHPPFFFRLECQSANAGELKKDLNGVFRDVNFLAGETVTLQFEGQSNIGDVNLQFVIKRNYGPAGSPADEVVVTNFTLTNTLSIKSISFTLGDNAGKTIDPDVNKTSISFCLRYPTNSLSDTQVTNFMLVGFESGPLIFPNYSVNQDISLSLAGSTLVPNPDGSDDEAIVTLNYNLDGSAGTAGLIFSSLPDADENIIIGGAFSTNPWQRGTSITVNPDDYVYLADRFSINSPFDATMTMVYERSTLAPPLSLTGVYSQNSLQVRSNSTSSGSPSDTADIQQNIEGYDFIKIAQKYSILSFYVWADVAGPYSVFVGNEGFDSSLTLRYNIDVAQTWQKIELVIPPSPSAGAWNYTNGLGILVAWELSVPPFPVSPSEEGIWITPPSEGKWGIPDQTNLFSATNQSFHIDQISLRPGRLSGRFIEHPISLLMTKCQRFYEKSYPLTMKPGTATSLSASGVGAYANLVANTNRGRMVCYYNTRKRIAGDNTTNFIWAYDGTRGEATHGGSNISPDTAGYFGEQTASYGEFSMDSTTIIAHFTSDAEFYY